MEILTCRVGQLILLALYSVFQGFGIPPRDGDLLLDGLGIRVRHAVVRGRAASMAAGVVEVVSTGVRARASGGGRGCSKRACRRGAPCSCVRVRTAARGPTRGDCGKQGQYGVSLRCDTGRQAAWRRRRARWAVVVVRMGWPCAEVGRRARMRKVGDRARTLAGELDILGEG